LNLHCFAVVKDYSGVEGLIEVVFGSCNIEDAWGDEEILKPEDDDEDLWIEDEEGKT